ncbi:hypothetical protein VFPPC_17721 [Pochonia chlamydosporia 170]|uniref:Uncharacterized protein n=1 Tax=Pochonia chlamydosporia 170 TaxID=1380566 RepID=A0A219AQP2_METCM|nr:hypothetical protein VFPPC_17721 [Pochonia chlamydosporia 170]OWT43103.1 hypothetical protein VFPPC_17721 [Pochonia chlamydosporia 170]
MAQSDSFLSSSQYPHVADALPSIEGQIKCLVLLTAHPNERHSHTQNDPAYYHEFCGLSSIFGFCQHCRDVLFLCKPKMQCLTCLLSSYSGLVVEAVFRGLWHEEN